METAFSDCAIDIPVEDVIVGDRVRKSLGDTIADLQLSMTKLGQLQPIGITRGNVLVFGWRRLEAARAMAWPTIRAVRLDSLATAEQLALAERDENTCREPFTPLETLEMARRIDALVPKKKPGPKVENNYVENFHVIPEEPKPAEKPEPRRAERVAKAVGVSGKTLKKIETVAKAAEAEPEKFAPVVAEMERTGKVEPAYQAVKQPDPDDGEAIRAKILERIGSDLERLIRQLCDTEAGRNVDRAKAVEALGRLVSAVKGERAPVHPQGDEPGLLEFPCAGKPNSWKLTEAQVTEWADLFPALDVLSECRAALAWVNAMPDRKKTFRGMPKFLVGWFGRAQDSGRHRSHAPPDKLSGLRSFVESQRGREVSPGVELIGGPSNEEWSADA